MIKSLIRKFFFAFLWLWVISILAFWLSKQVPGDEVLDYLSIENETFSKSLNPYQQREAYQQTAHKRGLDLPLFYFSLDKGIYPQSLETIFPEEDRNAIKGWINASHNSRGSMEFYSSLRQSLQSSCSNSSISPLADASCRKIHAMLIQPDINIVYSSLNELFQQSKTGNDLILINQLTNAKALSNNLQVKHKLSVVEFLPSFHWNGSKNQYHRWMTGLITLKPMVSLIDGRNAWTKIGEALKWTFILNGLAFILAIFLGVVIGIWSGVRDGSRKEKWASIILFTFFAIPAFWLATLLIFLLASGEWLSILPPGGLGNYHVANSIWEKWGIIGMHLILPVFCLTIGSLAYISRQMKQSVLHEYSQPYISSLRALGISEKTILRKHIIRNALFPMITMMGNAFPAIISGSLIIEVIFSIPGMGRLMFNSLMARDWPVVFPILMLGATVTIISYTLTDIVYKWLDPRVKSLN
jgi:peptide/nickel transport system permease protein